jgi:uncharacterized protein YjiK
LADGTALGGRDREHAEIADRHARGAAPGKPLLTKIVDYGYRLPEADSARGPSSDRSSSGIDPTRETHATRQDRAVVPRYDFDVPDAIFELPGRLEEISGLTVLESGVLAAVEDERGRVYLISPETGEVLDQQEFGKKGDYEAIESVGDQLFVLRSDGTLFRIRDVAAADWSADRIKTHLGPKNDTEGLAYDARGNRLLVVCKEHPGRGSKKTKAIYAFDLERSALSELPVFSIDIKHFNEKAEDGSASDWLRDAVEPLMDLSGFKPSGLALNPLTNELFVLSSVRRSIVVLTQNGEIHAVWKLPKKVFPQPEGIAFLSDGTLFISTEGNGGPARLVRYLPQ